MGDAAFRVFGIGLNHRLSAAETPFDRQDRVGRLRTMASQWQRGGSFEVRLCGSRRRGQASRAESVDSTTKLGFSFHIRRIRALVSASMGGRPPG